MAQALTRSIALRPRHLSCDRRNCLPAMAITGPPLSGLVAWIQFRKQVWHCSGARTRHTRQTVLCAGMPLVKSRNVANQARLLRPNPATATPALAPPLLAQMATAKIVSRYLQGGTHD